MEKVRQWKLTEKSCSSKYHPDHQRGSCLVLFGAPDEIYLCPNTTHSAVCHGLMAPLAVVTRPRLGKCTVRRSYRNCVMSSSVCLRIQSGHCSQKKPFNENQRHKNCFTRSKLNQFSESEEYLTNIQISKSAVSWKLGDFQSTRALSICGNNHILFQPDEKASMLTSAFC